MTTTKEVIDHHLKAFGELDLKGVLSDYAPGVVFFTPQGPLRGPDAIRPLFQSMITEFAKPGATFTMQQQFVEGDYATSCGTQRLRITCTSWERTHSRCNVARSWPNHSPARLRPRHEIMIVPSISVRIEAASSSVRFLNNSP